jgi:metal-responsive CopG/Arc/MetJ family transcriptional regulator
MTKKRLLRTQLITVRVPREDLKRLDVMALEQEKYRSELILEALRAFLAKDTALKVTRRPPVDSL